MDNESGVVDEQNSLTDLDLEAELDSTEMMPKAHHEKDQRGSRKRKCHRESTGTTIRMANSSSIEETKEPKPRK